ncbi:hypothetical protein CONLIGDRAFT_648968 [Coniochaeta ligniaria NRRL 30616]|uniref:Uncharacterized protein n=1 Tax=Coniochaeta ligniaria NRRL 30616 TaxID=1408157 RepID=A0A1J7J2X8_9PEZI|nr:hypothetical protein CONLIGDRAFT_648968 [Coniochaeta ligniaria NRRL 30616]
MVLFGTSSTQPLDLQWFRNLTCFTETKSGMLPFAYQVQRLDDVVHRLLCRTPATLDAVEDDDGVVENRDYSGGSLVAFVIAVVDIPASHRRDAAPSPEKEIPRGELWDVTSRRSRQGPVTLTPKYRWCCSDRTQYADEGHDYEYKSEPTLSTHNTPETHVWRPDPLAPDQVESDVSNFGQREGFGHGAPVGVVSDVLSSAGGQSIVSIPGAEAEELDVQLNSEPAVLEQQEHQLITTDEVPAAVVSQQPRRALCYTGAWSLPDSCF